MRAYVRSFWAFPFKIVVRNGMADLKYFGFPGALTRAQLLGVYGGSPPPTPLELGSGGRGPGPPAHWVRGIFTRLDRVR